jgi:hypothetical protein
MMGRWSTVSWPVLSTVVKGRGLSTTLDPMKYAWKMKIDEGGEMESALL